MMFSQNTFGKASSGCAYHRWTKKGCHPSSPKGKGTSSFLPITPVACSSAGEIHTARRQCPFRSKQTEASAVVKMVPTWSRHPGGQAWAIGAPLTLHRLLSLSLASGHSWPFNRMNTAVPACVRGSVWPAQKARSLSMANRIQSKFSQLARDSSHGLQGG